MSPDGSIGRRDEPFGVAGASWTHTSLELPVGLGFDDWEALGWALGRRLHRRAIGFGLGEALRKQVAVEPTNYPTTEKENDE